LDKLIPGALLLEAPPVARSVHLQKLLCGVTFYLSHTFKRFTSQRVLMAGHRKTRIEECEGSFVADATVDFGVWPTSDVRVGPSAQVCCDLPRITPYYDELLHTDASVLVNKFDSSKFGLVQRRAGARNLRNSVRELSGQASCFPNYKVAHSLSVGATHYRKLRETRFLCSCCSERPDNAGY